MEKFEKEGKWWLPHDRGNDLPGLLTFDPQNGGMLETIGRFKTDSFSGHHELLEKVELIHGSVRGSAFTLVGCQTKDYGDTYSPDYETLRYSVEYIYAGHHFMRYEDIQFRKLILGYTYLDNWAGIDGLQGGMSDHGYRTDLTGLFDIPTVQMRIKVQHQRMVDRWTRTEAKVRDVARIVLESDEKRPFLDFDELINFHIPNFLTLATLRMNFPRDIKGRVADNIGLIGVFFQIPSFTEETQPAYWTPILVHFDSVKHKLGNYLEQWVSRYEKLWAVYDLYFQTIFTRALKPKTEFLLFAQALEAYHRHSNKYKGEYLTKEEYEPTRELLVNAIPPNLKNPHKAKLEKMMEFGYQHSFRKRLKEIHDTYSAEYPGLMTALFDSRNDFSTAVNDTRNLLTHHEDSPDTKPLSEDDIPHYAFRLKLLLQLILLAEMSMTPEEISSILSECFYYKIFLDER